MESIDRRMCLKRIAAGVGAGRSAVLCFEVLPRLGREPQARPVRRSSAIHDFDGQFHETALERHTSSVRDRRAGQLVLLAKRSVSPTSPATNAWHPPILFSISQRHPSRSRQKVAIFTAGSSREGLPAADPVLRRRASILGA